MGTEVALESRWNQGQLQILIDCLTTVSLVRLEEWVLIGHLYAEGAPQVSWDEQEQLHLRTCFLR